MVLNKIDISKEIQCECGGIGELYNVYLKDNNTVGLQYGCSYGCDRDLDKLVPLEYAKEVKCDCGDTAIFENITTNDSNNGLGVDSININYLCYHRCDSIVTKVIKLNQI